MCSSGKAPKPQPQLPQAPVAPDVTVSQGINNNDRRRASANGTILTSSRGINQSASTEVKTLLGS